jgi:hypothetical protein
VPDDGQAADGIRARPDGGVRQARGELHPHRDLAVRVRAVAELPPGWTRA